MMSIRAIAVGTLLVGACVSLVMSRLMRRVPSILAPPLVLTRWMIFIFFSFLMPLLLSLLLNLLVLLRLLQPRRHPLLRLVPLVLLVLRLWILPLLFLLPLLLMSCLPPMSFPLHGLFVSVVLHTVTLLASMVSLLSPSRLIIGMPSVILNGSWPWLRRLLRLSAPAPGILFLPLPVFVLSRVSGFIKLRPVLMDLLSAIKRVLWLVVFSRS